METNTPVELIIGWTSLLLLLVLFYKFIRGLFEATHALGEVVTGVGTALLVHISKKEGEQKLFYERSWTHEEATVMLQELRLQLRNQNNFHRLPELAVIGPERAKTLLTIGVLTKIMPSSIEVQRRITFLEEKLRTGQIYTFSQN